MTLVLDDDLLPGRAAAADVSIQIGPLFNLNVDLASQRESDKGESAFPYACPDHGSKVVRCNQTYRCQGDGTEKAEQHLHPEGELLRARESTDGKLIHASKDEIADLRTGAMDKGVLELQVHPRSEVTAALRPDGLAYRVRPSKKGSRKPFAILKALAEQPDTVLVGWLRLKDSRRLYRVDVWNDQLMLQSLIDVDAMRGVDRIALPELDDTEVAAVADLAEQAVAPFDPEEYRFDKAAAVAAFVAKRAAGDDTPVAAPAAATVADDGDVISMLAASLKGTAKPKKAPAKKATASKKKVVAKSAA